MKKLILLSMMTLSMGLTAQISIEETSDVKKKIWRTSVRSQSITEYYESAGDTSYVFFYKNYKYKSIIDVQYLTIQNQAELKQLLGLIRSVIDEGKEYTITLGSGDAVILAKTMGTCEIFTTKGYTYFDKKSIDKILEAIDQSL